MAESRDCCVQAVRSEADTATVLSAWASSAAAQECPDVVDMIEEDGPFAALAKIQDRISCLQPKCVTIIASCAMPLPGSHHKVCAVNHKFQWLQMLSNKSYACLLRVA